MSRQRDIYRILDEGPSTAAEVAVELGITVRLASANLAELRRKGTVTSRPHSGGTAHRAVVNLYALAAA
jgi:DNA-binding CsgD family transcriptional regulator